MTGPILWRRLDTPGHESARIFSRESRWHLTGAAVFAYQRAHQGQPCRLDYSIVCDAEWRTVSGHVAGWVGAETVDLSISVGSGH